MTTAVAVKRRLRRHMGTAIIPTPTARRLSSSGVRDDGAEVVAWLEHANSKDPLVVDIQRLVRSGGTPSAFQLRILRRARADAELVRYRYGNHRIDRLAQRQARQAAVVAELVATVEEEAKSNREQHA